ncbi:conserved hypothetical protein [Methanocaldococcus infernus ME]|uniref:DUF4350 domain-containing protein n=1 Tax=Methanocaldococcus infernus (strain DSM 11812 / JCM 15783 / ME) TaxID=573063 RepID=D5VTK0_METIM|nr:DUF4350 domain-containing protein [Methanocaldococcus infernus]ADG13903.1 conserved hypothetical protein [Methanocaldococcus infernus ME]
MRKILKYVTIAIIGIIFISLPYFIPIIKSNTPYSVFNKKWNGCFEFGKLLYHLGNIKPIINPYSMYKFNSDGVLIIIAPDIDYSDEEINIIKNFLESGGILILADDTGKVNKLLEKLNIKEKIINKEVKDLFYYKNCNLVICRSPFGNVVFNYPSYINSKEGDIKTSIVTSKILMKKINYGEGEVILISDPDIFINGMYKYNKDFLKNFFKQFEGRTFYIDELHHSSFSLYDVGVVYIQNQVSNETKFLIFTVLVIGSYILSNIRLDLSRFLRKKIDLKEVAKKYNIDYKKLKEIIEKI